MKIFEHKGRILRAVGLVAALAVASLSTTNAAASDCTDWCAIAHANCEASCPPLFSPGHFKCIQKCAQEYQDCMSNCS